MRKLISLVTLSLFMVSAGISAQTTAISNAMVASTNLSEKVGVAAGVKGQVQLWRGGLQVGKVVSGGAEIYLGDRISTDAKSSLQILLLDQTTFTIGANSAIVVDQFIYDPSTDAGKVSVRVVEGTFRFITGKIAHKNPENMQVDLPNGTIGIRGTMVTGHVDGAKSLVVLTGPGDKNNTGSKHGEIVVGGKGGDEGKSVRIAKTGFGTEIEGEGEPKTPFQVPQAQLDEITSELSPQSGEDAAGEEKSDSTAGDDQVGSEKSATEEAGQSSVDAGNDLDASDSFTDLGAELGNKTTDSAQDEADDFGNIFDGITEVDQLATMTSGQAHFKGTNFPLYDSSDTQKGSFDVSYDINFGARTVGGGYSNIQGQATNNYNTGNAFQFNLPQIGFGNGTDGLAIYSYRSLSDSLGCSPGVCKADVDIILLNTSGGIASTSLVGVTLTDSGHPADGVDGVAVAPRLNGLTPP